MPGERAEANSLARKCLALPGAGMPEVIPSHWWEHFLHNQTAFLIKASLLFRPGKISISVPYHLGD